MILILFLTLMYKTMGGGSWSGVRFDNAVDDGLGKSARHTSNLNEAVVGENFSLAWQSLKQVSPLEVHLVPAVTSNAT